MRICAICESPTQSPDLRIYRTLLNRLLPEANINVIGSTSRPEFFSESIDKIWLFLEKEKYDRVLLIWNMLDDPLREPTKSCIDQCKSIKKGLVDLKESQHQRVDLVCIDDELEDWLLSDGEALRQYLTTLNNNQPPPIPIEDQPQPEHRRYPTQKLMELFTDTLGEARPYTRYAHAEPLVEYIRDLKKLGIYCPTFRRFAEKATGEDWSSLVARMKLAE